MKIFDNWKVLIVSVVLVFGVSFVGSLFTFGNTDSSWYLENKPSFTPPNWIFGPVWTILYLLIAFSLYFVWIKAKKDEKKVIAMVYGVNLFANALWSYLFFGIQNPLLSFVDLIVIFVSLIGMILVAGKIDGKAAWMLVPYLMWVGFAGILNIGFIN